MNMKNIPIKPIKTPDDYRRAMAQMQTLWDSPENSSEADVLEVLAILVEQYEKKHYPIESLDPIDAIRYEMDEHGWTQQDMVPYFGNKARVSEVLNRKRPLTLKMIKTLHHQLGIPASILLAK